MAVDFLAKIAHFFEEPQVLTDERNALLNAGKGEVITVDGQAYIVKTPRGDKRFRPISQQIQSKAESDSQRST